MTSYEKLSIILGFLTLAVVTVYTFLTYRMQQAVVKQIEVAHEQTEAVLRQAEAAMVQTTAIQQQTHAAIEQTHELIYQRKLSLMPKLIASTRSDEADFITVVNIGNGTAVSVQIDDVIIPYKESTARLKFGSLLYLNPIKANSSSKKAPDITIIVEYAGDLFGEESAESIADLSLPTELMMNSSQDGRITLNFKFQDIDGTKYSQSIILAVSPDARLVTLDPGKPIEERRVPAEKSLQKADYR